MRRLERLCNRKLPLRSAFTMVEASFSVLLVGGLVVTALNTVGASTVAQKTIGDHRAGQALALDLMSEILQEEYADPSETPVFGPESSETAGSRATFDDVDDYHDYKEDPPQYENGTDIPGYSDWNRVVVVEWVSARDVTTAEGSETGCKRVTVTVLRNGAIVSTLTSVYTAEEPPAGGWPSKL